MSCVRTAEAIKMQFGMLSQMGPGNMHYMGMSVPPWERALVDVSGRLKSIVKHRILGAG